MKLKRLLVVNLSLSLPVFAGTPFFQPSDKACAGLDREIRDTANQITLALGKRQTYALKDQLRHLENKRQHCVKQGYSVE